MLQVFASHDYQNSSHSKKMKAIRCQRRVTTIASEQVIRQSLLLLFHSSTKTCLNWIRLSLTQLDYTRRLQWDGLDISQFRQIITLRSEVRRRQNEIPKPVPLQMIRRRFRLQKHFHSTKTSTALWKVYDRLWYSFLSNCERQVLLSLIKWKSCAQSEIEWRPS